MLITRLFVLIFLLITSLYSYPMVYCEGAELVQFGSNLGSTVGTVLTQFLRNIIQLPPDIYSVVIGLLLSDGWLSFSKRSKNARLGFNQSTKHFPYFWSVRNLLSHYCSSMPYIIKGITNGTPTFAVGFYTRSLPVFTELSLLFYVNGKKVVPLDIFHLLIPIALAHWIHGDGYKTGPGLILCTDSFSTEQVVLLMNVLMVKYRLNCTLRMHNKTYPRIYIRAESMDTLRKIVLPFMHDSFLYKLDL